MSSGESSGRVLVVCQHFWPEQFRINDIVDFMIDSGYEVDVLCGKPNYPSGRLADGYSLWNRRKEKYRSATIYRSFEIPRGNNRNLRILLNYLSYPVSSTFRAFSLLGKKYDRILIYQLSPVMMAHAGILLGKLKRVPTAMYVLDLWPENLFSVLDIKNPLLRRWATKTSHWYYRRADKLIALSGRMREKLLEVTKKSESEILVLPQVAEKLYETLISDQSLEQRFSDTFNIVFTGNISPAQSFGTMLDAAELIRDAGITDVRWVIVGDGMSKADVQQEVITRGLTDCFYFEGHQPVAEMPKYTNIADVLVGCLVKSELLEATIPAKVMSYIASGRPIVLAMDGEVQELINQEIRCGFAGTTEDSKDLAANLLRVYYSSDEERHAMGERARDYHFVHFERDAALTSLLKFVFA